MRLKKRSMYLIEHVFEHFFSCLCALAFATPRTGVCSAFLFEHVLLCSSSANPIWPALVSWHRCRCRSSG